MARPKKDENKPVNNVVKKTNSTIKPSPKKESNTLVLDESPSLGSINVITQKKHVNLDVEPIIEKSIKKESVICDNTKIESLLTDIKVLLIEIKEKNVELTPSPTQQLETRRTLDSFTISELDLMYRINDSILQKTDPRLKHDYYFNLRDKNNKIFNEIEKRQNDIIWD